MKLKKIPTLLFSNIYIMFFSISVYSSTSSVNAVNLFTSPINGESSESHKNQKTKDSIKKVIQGKTTKETLTETNNPIKNALIQYYKNLILDLIRKNNVTTKMLGSAIQNKDFFFRNFTEISTNTNTRPHLTALSEIQKKLKSIYSENEMEEILLEFLKSEDRKLTEISEITESVTLDTESILIPEILQKTGMNSTDPTIQYNYTNLENGDLVVSISQLETKILTLYNITKNTTKAINLEAIIRSVYYKRTFFSDSEINFINHRIYLNRNGELISAVRGTGGEFFLVNILNSSVLGNKELYLSIEEQLFPEVIELETGEKTILVTSNLGKHLLSLDTGKLIYYPVNKKILGFNFTTKNDILLNWDSESQKIYKLFQTISDGKKILILVFARNTIILDVNTGAQIHDKIPFGNSDKLDIELITLNNKKYIKYIAYNNTLTLIEIESRETLEFQYNFSDLLEDKIKEELTFSIKLNKELNKFIFVNKRNHLEIFPSIDISSYLSNLDAFRDEHFNSFIFNNPFTLKSKNGELIIAINFAFRTFFINAQTGKLLYVENYKNYLMNSDLHSKKTIKDSFFYSKKNEPVLIKTDGQKIKFISGTTGMEIYSPIILSNVILYIELFYNPALNSYFIFANTATDTQLIRLEYVDWPPLFGQLKANLV